MSRSLADIVSALYCFPRVSGDEPERIDDYSYTLEFSPREWG